MYSGTDNECFIVNVPVVFHFGLWLKSSLFDLHRVSKRSFLCLSDEREMHRFICNCFDILNLISAPLTFRYVILIEKSEFLCSLFFFFSFRLILLLLRSTIFFLLLLHSFLYPFLFFSFSLMLLKKNKNLKDFLNKSTAWIFIQNCTS